MLVTERRFDVQVIDAQSLAAYMEQREYTVRTLADAVERELRRRRVANPRVSHSVIGHLRNPNSGRRYCRPEVAKAIEKILNAPPGSLFVERLSSVQRETRPGAA